MCLTFRFRHFIFILFFSLIAIALWGQTDSLSSTEWFTVTRVAEAVWQISDHGIDNFYLVLGKEKALLIDTGIGVADVKACIRGITSLPVLVVNTHGHPDHAGGNFQFDSVFAHPGDWEMIHKVNTPESHAEWVKRISEDMPEMKSVLLEFTHLDSLLLKPISDGAIFDLGERKIEVIETPGHTPGSICLPVGFPFWISFYRR